MKNAYLVKTEELINKELELYRESKIEMVRTAIIGKCKGILEGLKIYASMVEDLDEKLELMKEVDRLWYEIDSTENYDTPNLLEGIEKDLDNQH